MSRRASVLLCSVLSLWALALGGCGQDSYAKEYYILDVIRQAGSPETRGDASLEVRRFNINTAYASRNLVYRLGRYQYEPDYYRQFMIAPATMITEETRHWLAESGLFKQVLPPGSQIAPTYTLQALITALYGDFTDRATPAAVMRIRFFLTQHKGGSDTVVFSQSYRMATPLSDRTGQELIDASSKNLVEILTRLEDDLRTVLAGKTDETARPENPTP
jgi:cholesterol transport system auxiliary component